MGSDYLRLCKGEERLTPRPWVVHEAVEREKPGVWSASHIHIPRPQLEAETAETVALCLPVIPLPTSSVRPPDAAIKGLLRGRQSTSRHRAAETLAIQMLHSGGSSVQTSSPS